MSQRHTQHFWIYVTDWLQINHPQPWWFSKNHRSPAPKSRILKPKEARTYLLNPKARTTLWIPKISELRGQNKLRGRHHCYLLSNIKNATMFNQDAATIQSVSNITSFSGFWEDLSKGVIKNPIRPLPKLFNLYKQYFRNSTVSESKLASENLFYPFFMCKLVALLKSKYFLSTCLPLLRFKIVNQYQ